MGSSGRGGKIRRQREAEQHKSPANNGEMVLRAGSDNLDASRSPSDADKDQAEERKQAFREAVADQIFAGKKPNEIAKAVYPTDKRGRNRLKRQIRDMLRKDPKFEAAVHQRAKARLLEGLGRATDGLIERAASGRPDAIKLLFEASGFHNPRVDHQHEGDIQITLNLPRPAPTPVDTQTQEVMDADVVEETPTG